MDVIVIIIIFFFAHFVQFIQLLSHTDDTKQTFYLSLSVIIGQYALHCITGMFMGVEYGKVPLY